MGWPDFGSYSYRNLFVGSGRRLWRTKAFFREEAEKMAHLPRLEVKLEPVHPIPKWGFPREDITEAKSQSLQITVHGSSVSNLTAQVWVSDHGPNYLEWRFPKEQLEPPEMTLSPGGKQEVSPGKMTIKIYNLKIDVTKEDSVPLLVWHAWRVKGRRDTMNLNLNPVVAFFPEDHEPGTKTWIRVKFLADQEIAEGDEHNFLLTFGGWDRMGLEEIAGERLQAVKSRLATVANEVHITEEDLRREPPTSEGHVP